MTVSIPFLKGDCCSSAIPSIEPSSIKEEMVLIEGVVVLAFTVDIALIIRTVQPVFKLMHEGFLPCAAVD
jgi:hypothetical protein